MLHDDAVHCRRSLDSLGNTGEAYLLASLNSEMAAMLLLSCWRAESTPAVTCSAFCTVKLWLINPANSNSLSPPAPPDLYNSYLWLSELGCSTCVLSPYLSCCRCGQLGRSFLIPRVQVPNNIHGTNHIALRQRHKLQKLCAHIQEPFRRISAVPFRS